MSSIPNVCHISNNIRYCTHIQSVYEYGVYGCGVNVWYQLSLGCVGYCECQKYEKN
jgi:hypothetical protein